MESKHPGRTAVDAMYLHRFMHLSREVASQGPLPARSHPGIRRPVFVCGSPRSGTTLLGKCLGHHPDAEVAEESYFLMDLFMLHANHFWGLNRDDWTPLRAYVDEDQMINMAGRYADAVFGTLLNRRNVSHFVDHTPWYGLLAPFLAALYPEGRIVHIIRDGRAVVRSLTALAREGVVWAQQSIGERAQLWQEVVSRTRRLGPVFFEDRYIEVRYEALCNQPEQTLSEVVQRLGWTWNAAVLAPLAVPHSTPTRKAVPLAAVHTNGDLRLQPRQTPDVWPEDWDEKDRHSFTHHAHALMVDLGYT